MKHFYDLRQGGTPRLHRLKVEDRYTVNGPGQPFLFGGIGLGACIMAAERTTGRSAVWATAQYLSFAPAGADVEIEVVPLSEGRHTTQARAVVRLDGKDIIVASLSLGARPGADCRQFARPRPLPDPADCPSLPVRWSSMPGDLYDHFEARIGAGWDAPQGGEGGVSLWISSRADLPFDRPLLALVGDYVAGAIGNLLGSEAGDCAINSLDNTIRFLAAPPRTRWVQCEIRLEGASEGYAHGHMTIFTEDGQLLASASQSVLVRNQLFPRR